MTEGGMPRKCSMQSAECGSDTYRCRKVRVPKLNFDLFRAISTYSASVFRAISRYFDLIRGISGYFDLFRDKIFFCKLTADEPQGDKGTEAACISTPRKQRATLALAYAFVNFVTFCEKSARIQPNRT